MGYIIRLSLANIKLRKLRTILTIVGIMIGIMSIVTMLTAGIGAKQTMIDEVEKSGNTREITVYTENTSRKDRLLTDAVADKIGKLDYVTGVYPVLEMSGDEKLAGCIGWNSILGVPEEYLKMLTLKEGELPTRNGARPELVAGLGVRDSIYNERTWQQYSKSVKGGETLAGSRMDFHLSALDSMTQTEDEDEATASAGDATSYDSKETDSYVQEPVYQKLKIVGETDNEYDYYFYTDIETAKMYLKRQMVDGKIPGQPLDKNNRPYTTWAYSSFIVRVDSVDNVKRVSKNIQDMGFKVYNNLETLESVTKTINMVQFVLGAVGAIAGVVAIIGIVNTMMTAVYDRVREIGLLKMLGADSDDISFMFLFESAMLGGIGGVLGVALSLVVDIYINKKLVEFMKMPEGSWIMAAPSWLIIGAILASILVSVLAGAIPTRWAARIKPLDAIAK